MKSHGLFMYCMKCGVELAASERTCPLCGTAAYHPELPAPDGAPTYPPRYPERRHINRHAPLYLISLLAVMIGIQLIVLDIRTGAGLSWSYYATGGLILGYLYVVLPLWFRRPNPVIFVPCDFAATILYVLGINILTGGDWFMSFAFPVVGGFGLLTTTVLALCRYVRRGYFFIWGGAVLALGGYLVLLEMFIHITFSPAHTIFWSFYPLVGCILFGAFLLLAGICRPLREALAKKFFL
ncbi:MAG: hypothetical protein IJW40_06650 [Clostridia bacterium]|nr:hypothetical protein [Clostridia bacterium]